MLAALLTLFWACGYQLSGSGSLPGGIKRIHMSVMNNRTAESGLEMKVTNAVIDELTRRGQNVVAQPDQAEAVLTGVIDSLATETIARSGSITATERRVVITASFTLKDPKGKVLWQAQQLRAEQAYAVSDINRLQAINTVSQRLAESVYDRLTDSF
ncbi:MAG: LptE family protein [Desulfobacteraceae bacterium]|nr:LptE family protein [Desulfobacteraceae bacterium]